MIKTTVKIDGMMCGMCEAHMCDAIRNNIPGATKVTASHKDGTASFVTDAAPEETTVKEIVEDTGYTYISSSSEEYVKKGLFGR